MRSMSVNAPGGRPRTPKPEPPPPKENRQLGRAGSEGNGESKSFSEQTIVSHDSPRKSTTKASPGHAAFSVYVGLEHVGDVRHELGGWLALDADGELIGRYQTREAASIAVWKARGQS